MHARRKKLGIYFEIFNALKYNKDKRGGNNMKAEYKFSKQHDLGLEMFFEYKGKSYSIIRAYTYPQSERQQHQDEQNKIDNNKITKSTMTESAKVSLEKFFKEIEEVVLMYQLYDSQDIQYGQFISLNDCYSQIRKYLQAVGFKSYYYRQKFVKDGLVKLSYGSQDHFFYITQKEGVAHE
jgi:hypothetical protein